MASGRWRESFQRWLGDAGPRVSGPPRSSNGASSLHLRWVLDGAFRAAEVTLEVLEPPRVPLLYFWAMQTDLATGPDPGGGAHLGLQWHPGHPGSTAVNWGGYRPGGGELDGSRSELSSAQGNPNTRDHPWRAGVPYRLRVEAAGSAPGGPTAWRGSVTDLERDHIVVVRDLYAAARDIRGVVMWSEVFARCDDPSVTVRWSDPVAVTDDGVAVEPSGLLVNYQSHVDGGCANTTSVADARGVLQRTNTPRVTPQGARLSTSDPSR